MRSALACIRAMITYMNADSPYIYMHVISACMRMGINCMSAADSPGMGVYSVCIRAMVNYIRAKPSSLRGLLYEPEVILYACVFYLYACDAKSERVTFTCALPIKSPSNEFNRC